MKKKDKKRLFKILLSLVLFSFSFVANVFDKRVGLVLVFTSFAVIGLDVLRSAFVSLFHGQMLDENFLMSIATVGAIFTGQYHEAVFVMVFYQVGELFQSIAIGKSRRSIANLCDMNPDSARLVTQDGYVEANPCCVEIGDIIEVRPGEKIPLDGIIKSGDSTLDSSKLTGESLPLVCSVGDKVLSGCVNISGVITIETTTTLESSTASKILELVENSTANKSKSEAFITRFARYYTPFVVISALLVALLPPLFLGIGDISVLKTWVYRAMTFLVISCPCALVISVPLTFFGGIGCASRHGILVKGANYLEMLALCDAIVFDKTGTLTEGNLSVQSVLAQGVSEKELLTLAAAAERKSNHPIAQAILKAADTDTTADDITELVGKGIKASYNGKALYVGNKALLSDCGIVASHQSDSTCIYIAYDNKYCGCITFIDKIKSGAKSAIANLNMKTYMLSGDKRQTANAVANQLCIDNAMSELLPESKVSAYEQISRDHRHVAFVGDGINDAPVLARSDVGIAMGGIGSDAAIEAADIVIMDDDLQKLVKAKKISRLTQKTVTQNIVFVLTVKAVTLLLGAIGLANMWMAIFADVGVAVIAILNSVKIINRKF